MHLSHKILTTNCLQEKQKHLDLFAKVLQYFDTCNVESMKKQIHQADNSRVQRVRICLPAQIEDTLNLCNSVPYSVRKRWSVKISIT